jgi:hypothetical protein
MIYYTIDPMEADPKNIRLKVAFILIWLFLITLFAFGQDKPKRYRVRAVSNIYYIPDTIAWGSDLQVYSPYLDSIVFKLESAQGFPLVVFTRTFQATSTVTLQPGKYGWELLYKDQDGIVKIDRGTLVIK